MTDSALSSRILSRVRKLLNLANDAAATEGERDNAMRMAYATLAKHNLSMTDVGDGAVADEARQESKIEEVVYPWARTISHAIANLFFCGYYFTHPARGKKGRHAFIGRVSNSTTASELAAFVIRSVHKESVKRYGSATSPEACSFDKGAAARIFARCSALRAEAEAANKAEASTGRELVLASVYDTERTANALWVAEHVGKLTVAKNRQKDTVQRGAFAAGKDYGNTVSLSASLGGAGAARTAIR